MKGVNLTIIVIFHLLSILPSKAQTFFKGGIVAGINASQIDGDQIAGYKKIGISAGLKVEFPISSMFDMGAEFLFSQRGSRSSFVRGQFDDIARIHLNYAELPVFIKWNDWWIEEEEYYKFNLHGGLSPGRLISFNTNFGPNAISGTFSNYDISFFLGGGFSYSKNWTISARFTRSINRLYTQEVSSGSDIVALLGYFITLRSEYTF